MPAISAHALKVLQRRADHIAERVAVARADHKEPSSYDLAELSALNQALGILYKEKGAR